MPNKKIVSSVKLSNDGTFSNPAIKEIFLDYYLVDQMTVLEDGGNAVCYGIDIVKKEVHENNKTYIEDKNIENISCCEKSIIGLIKKLAHHTVTPMTLEDILHDMVGITDLESAGGEQTSVA